MLSIKLKNKIEAFMQPVVGLQSANVMRKLLFGYVLFNFLQILPAMDVLYGMENSVIKTWNQTGYTLTTLANLLSINALKSYYGLFFGLQVFFALIGLFGFYPRISSFIVFFMSINLQNRIYSTVSGGDILLCLMLFYLSFISDGKELKNENLSQIRNAFNRAFVWLCKIQLLVIYSVSAIYKLQSPEWLNGSALQHILRIDEYSFPALQHLVCIAPFLFKILTWLTLLYQILFPILIFVKRAKNYLLLSGIIFHLFIAFGMGLFNFGLVMICCYVIFYDFRKAETQTQ